MTTCAAGDGLNAAADLGRCAYGRKNHSRDKRILRRIDGCKAGWFSVCLHKSNSWNLQLFEDIEQIWNSLNEAELIFIDIPLGLRESGKLGRACDTIARRLLGSRRASSIFTPAVRAALKFKDRATASAKNYSLTGRRIGAQSWAITPKTKEVDQFLRANQNARKKIKEVHPELLFWALNGCKAMSHKKSRREGFEERLRVLRRHFSHSDAVVEEALFSFPRSKVKRDDILDALAAAVTAFLGKKNIISIPKEPELDTFGIPMEMVYYIPNVRQAAQPITPADALQRG